MAVAAGQGRAEQGRRGKAGQEGQAIGGCGWRASAASWCRPPPTALPSPQSERERERERPHDHMDGKQLLIGGGPANMGSIRQEGRRDGTRSEAGAASITVDLVGRNKRQPGSAYCSPHRDVSQGGKPRPRENRRSSYKTRSRKKRAAAYCALREGENRKADRHLKYLRRVCTMQRYVTRNLYSAQRYNEVRKEWVQMDGSINK